MQYRLLVPWSSDTIPSSRDLFCVYLEHVEHLYRQRLFSKAGEVVAARRSNIKPKNVDLILLNKHLLCFGIIQWDVEFFVCLGEGGSIIWYGIEPPLPGNTHC